MAETGSFGTGLPFQALGEAMKTKKNKNKECLNRFDGIILSGALNFLKQKGTDNS